MLCSFKRFCFKKNQSQSIHMSFIRDSLGEGGGCKIKNLDNLINLIPLLEQIKVQFWFCLF